MKKDSKQEQRKWNWRGFFQNRDPNVPLKKMTLLKFGLLAMVLGVLLIVFSPSRDELQKEVTEMVSQNDQTEVIEASADMEASNPIRTQEKIFEQQLKDLLEQMVGVSNVSVVVNLASTPKVVYEKNTTAQNQQTTEEDKQGGQRKIEQKNTSEQLVTVREGNNEVPVIQNQVKADIVGVAVVAKGADQIQVKKQVVDTVTRLLGVPSHRVSVSAKKS